MCFVPTMAAVSTESVSVPLVTQEQVVSLKYVSLTSLICEMVHIITLYSYCCLYCMFSNVSLITTYCVYVVVIPHRRIHLRVLVSIEVFNKERQEGLITLQQSSFVR